MTPPQQPGPARAALSRELGEFLIELSIALNKFSMYPDGHPSLRPAVEGLLRTLEQLLLERGSLSLGVARQQLVIEGVATDTNNPVLKDLAGRLHRHHLGAITFSRGAELDELIEFVGRVAVEADRAEQPLGLMIAQLAAWPHVRMHPLMYDRLELLDERDQEPAQADDPAARSQRTRAAQLWVGMARAALAAGDSVPQDVVSGDRLPVSGTPSRSPEHRTPDTGHRQSAAGTAQPATDPASVARAIEEHPRGTAYDQVIVGYMLQIAEELRGAGTAEATQLKKRMSRLVSTLEPHTLERLLDMGGDGMQRRQFLLNASQGMAVDAVLDLVNAASHTEEQTISHSMLRMLQKLARHADRGMGERRVVAEQSVRDQVGELIRGWSLKDPNPDAYRHALEALSTADPVFAVAPEAVYLPGPQRIVQMALEVDATGEPLTRAIRELMEKDQLLWLVETLKTAARSSTVSEIWRQIATPEQLAAVLRVPPLNIELVDALLPQLGMAAAGVLLDALIAVDSGQTRRLLLDRIIGLGFEVAPLAMQRLGDQRWYVQRNMLRILGDLEVIPPDLRASDYLQHEEARVRREALRIVLRDPALRERAICRGLGDPDERMVRAALTAALQSCPPTALPLVSSRALSGTSEDQRVLAIRVLGASGVRSAVDALLRLTAPRKTWFGARPPDKTPEYLAAIAALRSFGDDPRARAILDQAARSRDADVTRAAAGGGTTA
ncbi:MAG: HEAT repeat domain-containing protein [Gemmatimonadetes bacterium]|nr:HEAT repeat domain-containing protein [Gemmatimonadota bacterium]